MQRKKLRDLRNGSGLALVAALVVYSSGVAHAAPAASIQTSDFTIGAETETSGTAITNPLAMGPPAIPEAINEGRAWKVHKTEWDENDEAGYAAFVQAIGWSNCTSLSSCLKSAANPYRHTDTRSFSGDCADMAYILRAYYAWKNALPFSYQSAMRTADGSGEDIRYSSNGNIVAGRRNAIGPRPVDAPGFIGRMPGEVSTAMFRTHPETGGGRAFDDFYPVKINRDAVRPGDIAYDIFGHVGLVYDILEDGRVLIIASHPDLSVTRTVFGRNFLRAQPALGAGLKAWRPIKLVGATKNNDGSYIGGRIRAAKNEDLPNYSTEQFLGTHPSPNGDWRLGEFKYDGLLVDYYDYVRLSLAAPRYQFNPVTELRDGLEALCGAIRDRKYAVDAARSAKIHLKSHPARLPPNIYGTYGTWEEYSTPSRDARLKVAFIELRRRVERLVNDYRNGVSRVAYDGDDLAGDLIDVFETERAQCVFSYWRTDGSRVGLDLAHVMYRLWDLSFDPYHCPERRWGAMGAELATCSDDQTKTAWYNAQRFLRFQAERTYNIRMDFTLDELKPPALASPRQGGLGVDAPADANILAYLNSLEDADREKPPLLMAKGQTGELLTKAAGDQFNEPRFPEWHYKILNKWTAPKTISAAE